MKKLPQLSGPQATETSGADVEGRRMAFWALSHPEPGSLLSLGLGGIFPNMYPNSGCLTRSA